MPIHLIRRPSRASRWLWVTLAAVLAAVVMSPAAEAATKRSTATVWVTVSAKSTATSWANSTTKATVTARAAARAKGVATRTGRTTREARSRATSAARAKARATAHSKALALASSRARARAKAKAESLAKSAKPAPVPAPEPAPAPAPEPAPAPAPVEEQDECGAVLRKVDGTTWTCSFADSFEGAALDASKWTPATTERTGLSYGDCFVEGQDNIEVSDGTLKLTTREEPDAFSCPSLTGNFDTKYTSGNVTTHGKFGQAFGRFEIRAKMPSNVTAGVHSALWLFPVEWKYGVWPLSGEIDVAEFYSAHPDRLIPALHYHSLAPWADRTNNHCLVDDPTRFHTYAVEWTAERITVSYDGKTCLDHVINAAAPLTGSAPFDHPYSVNLTQSLGSFENQLVAGVTQLPATLEIDHVRVWK